MKYVPLWLVGLAGCLSTGGGTDGDTSCAPIPLGTDFYAGEWGTSSSFEFVCPTANPDAGTGDGTAIYNFDDGGVGATVYEGSDLACVLPIATLAGTTAVAVGAPFQLQYALPNPDDAPLPVQPAVASFAQSTAQGWVLSRPGYVTFVAWSGSKAANYVQLLAQRLDSIRLFAVGLGCPSDALLPLDGASPAGCRTFVGTPAVVVAMMEGDAGWLAGSVECTFASSNPAVLAVSGRGIVAHVTPVSEGNATLTATCMGQEESLNVQVALSLDDGGAPEASAEGDDAIAEAGDVSVEAGVTNAEAGDANTEADGAIDAGDVGADAQPEGD